MSFVVEWVTDIQKLITTVADIKILLKESCMTHHLKQEVGHIFGDYRNGKTILSPFHLSQLLSAEQKAKHFYGGKLNKFQNTNII